LSREGHKPQNGGMEHANDTFYEAWQQSVREYVRMVRAVRTRGISHEELDILTRPYIQRVDSAYAKFKQLKREGTDFCPDASY
jgi:hypothetical protein